MLIWNLTTFQSICNFWWTLQCMVIIEMKVVLVRKTRNGFFWRSKISISWHTFQSRLPMNPKKWIINYSTPFNFEKFYKAKLNFKLMRWTPLDLECGQFHRINFDFWKNSKFENKYLEKEGTMTRKWSLVSSWVHLGFNSEQRQK